MQLGMVGLGRMGGNMTKRLEQGGHHVMTFDPKVESTAAYRTSRSSRSSS